MDLGVEDGMRYQFICTMQHVGMGWVQASVVQ